MLRRFRRLTARVVPALLLLHCAFASDVPRLSFNQMTDDSELVVSGKVTRTWTEWDPDHKYIWTHYELAVSATQKGAAGPTVDIAEPGGQLNGMGMSISGATGYGVGENVLVFLSRMPNGYLRTAGLGQGKFTVDSTGHVHGGMALKIAETATMDARPAAAASAAVRSLEGMSVRQVSQLVAARVRTQGGNPR